METADERREQTDGDHEGPELVSTEHLVSVVGDDAVDDALVATIEQAALATLQQQDVKPPVELTIALMSSPEIRELNCRYRQVDAETDVLSFGMAEDQPLSGPPGAGRYLGDIAICGPRAEAQAAEYGHSVSREFAYLTVHGVLHLLGFDHHMPEAQRHMRLVEEAALQRIGLARSADQDRPIDEGVYSSHHAVQQKG